MAAAKKEVQNSGSNNYLNETLKGCYGSRITPSQVKEWLVENIMSNIDRDVRITLNVMGAPGCVFKDTLITVKKVSNENGHKIFIK